MHTRSRSAAAQVSRIALLGHVPAHLGVHPLGGAPEGELAQRDQIALAEESVDGAAGLFGDVDLAFAEPLQQHIRGHIDQLDLVGPLQQGVRHGLADLDASDLRDDVVEALDVLDVERGVDVDARREQLVRILPALVVTGAWSIGVGQLVQQEECGTPRKRGVEVELLQPRAAIVDDATRDGLQPSISRAVSTRPWVSTTPTTTSTPSARLPRAASSML